jgi:TusE/DsrC/DsvC family sulfur relay protein
MSIVTIAGLNVDVNEEGYLTDSSQWNEEVAAEIAHEEEVELSEKHFELLNFLRKQHEDGVDITIRKVGKSGLIDIKGFYGLFPKKPLKKSSRIAGIPTPSSCV